MASTGQHQEIVFKADPHFSALPDAQLIKQGAEAKVFRGKFLGRSCVVKQRFKKKYRHPALDEKLTQKRTAQEVRSLVRCRKAGLFDGVEPATRLFSLNLKPKCITGSLDIVNSITVRENIEAIQSRADSLDELFQLAEAIGKILATMHKSDVIHGDLTTSNMLIRQQATDSKYHPRAVVLIDFGLSHISALAEDKGVDLYVLERAFLSTHPNTEEVFSRVLKAYRESYKRSEEVIKKLDEVRQRGRKRVMVG